MKATLIALVVVAGLIAFTVFDTKRTEKAETAATEKQKLLRLPVADLNRIEVHPRGGTAIVLQKTDGQWALTEPIREVADQQEVANLIRSLANEKATETVIEGSQTDYSVYGLLEPSFEVRLGDTHGGNERIRIGSVKAYDDNLYARVNDDAKVELASSAWDSLLSKRAAEFRDKRLYKQSADPDRIELVQRTAGYPARMILNKSGEDWKVVEGDASYPLSNDRVNAYLEKIRDLRAQDFHAEDKEAPGIAFKFGLKPAATELKLFTGEKVIFGLALSAPDKRGDVYATSSDFKPVVSIYKLNAETVARRADDFFAKKRPFTFPAEEASRISIMTDAGNAEFEKTGSDWSKSGMKLADAGPVTRLIEKLAGAETLRIFEATQNLPKGPKSKIEIRDAKGLTLLRFEFGPTRIEKALGSRPEAKYILGLTNKSDRLLGLPPKMIDDLNLPVLLKLGQNQK